MNGLPSAALEEAERLRQEVRELELENEASVPIDLMAEEIEKAAEGLFEHSLSIPEVIFYPPLLNLLTEFTFISLYPLYSKKSPLLLVTADLSKIISRKPTRR